MRYKLYKSGKNWLIAGITVGSMVLGATTASADSATETSSIDETVTETADSQQPSSMTKSNLTVISKDDVQPDNSADEPSNATEPSATKTSTVTTDTNATPVATKADDTSDPTAPQGEVTDANVKKVTSGADATETASQPAKVINIPVTTSDEDAKKTLDDASAEYDQTKEPVTVTRTDATAPASSAPVKATTVNGNVTTTDTTKIPADYAFTPLTDVGGTTVISNQGGTTEAKDSALNTTWSDADKGVAFKASDIVKGKTAVRISNVGYSDAGDLLDQLTTIMDYTLTDNISNDDIKAAGIRINANSIDVEALADLKYKITYVKHGTNTEVALPGLVVLSDLDEGQSFTLSASDFAKVDKVYVPLNSNGTNNIYEYKNSNGSVAFLGTVANANTADGAIQLAMSNVSGVTFNYVPRDKQTVEVLPDITNNVDAWHERGSNTNIGTPSIKYGISDTSVPKITVSTNRLANTTASYTYKVTQTVAAADKSSYYSTGSFVLTVDNGKTDSVKVDPSTIVIKDMMTGKNVTGLRPVIDGNTITINLKNKLSSADFYGKRYEITFGVTAQDKLQGDYVVNASASWTFNGDKENSKTVTTTIPKSVVNLTIRYIDEDGNVLLSGDGNGQYGDTYDSTPKDLGDQYDVDLSKLPTNAKGALDMGNTIVTYVYHLTKGDWTDVGDGSRVIALIGNNDNVKSVAETFSDDSGYTITYHNNSINVLVGLDDDKYTADLNQGDSAKAELSNAKIKYTFTYSDDGTILVHRENGSNITDTTIDSKKISFKSSNLLANNTKNITATEVDMISGTELKQSYSQELPEGVRLEITRTGATFKVTVLMDGKQKGIVAIAEGQSVTLFNDDYRLTGLQLKDGELSIFDFVNGKYDEYTLDETSTWSLSEDAYAMPDDTKYSDDLNSGNVLADENGKINWGNSGEFSTNVKNKLKKTTSKTSKNLTKNDSELTPNANNGLPQNFALLKTAKASNMTTQMKLQDVQKASENEVKTGGDSEQGSSRTNNNSEKTIGSKNATGVNARSNEKPRTNGKINNLWIWIGAVVAILIGFWFFIIGKRRKDNDEKEATN